MKYIQLDGNHIGPSKIVCIGRNYVDHIQELDNEMPEEPVIFMKPNSAISNEIISIEHDVIHFEGEISFLIIDDQLTGVGFGLDLTKRKIQSNLKAKGLPWERAKSFDNSAVFSPFVTYSGEINALRMELHVNGGLAQQGGCDLMLHKPNDLLREAKGFVSFENGDVLMTGTPGGVGPINSGDRFDGKIYENENLIVEGFWVVR